MRSYIIDPKSNKAIVNGSWITKDRSQKAQSLNRCGLFLAIYNRRLFIRADASY